MTLRSRIPRLTLSPEILVLQENLNCSSLHDFASKQKCHVEDHSVFCDHHHHHGVHQISIYMIYMIVQIRPLVLNLENESISNLQATILQTITLEQSSSTKVVQ